MASNYQRKPTVGVRPEFYALIVKRAKELGIGPSRLVARAIDKTFAGVPRTKTKYTGRVP